MEIKEKIKSQWNNIAEDRYNDLISGRDSSFNTILLPAIFNVLTKCDLNNVLDLGCGVGVLTKEIAKIANNVTGIDISDQSINIAKKNLSYSNIQFENVSIENHVPNSLYSTILCNMVLMDMECNLFTLKKIKSCLTSNGKAIFIIIHPFFWPVYRNYYKNTNFDYQKEILVEEPFQISGKRYNHKKTIHFHRPLSFYINLFIKCGFRLIAMEELYDKKEKKDITYPRFLLLEYLNEK